MMPYIGEFVGTALLVMLGDSVVSNCTLDKSGMKGGGSLQITIAWAFAVMLPACIFGASSGAHFNPALTLGLATIGLFPWSMVLGYFIAQMAGGFVGAVLMYIFWRDQFAATADPGTKLGCFCTRPAIRNIPQNFICEVMATFILVFALLGFGQVAGAAASGVNFIYVWGIILGIGASMGGATGYAMNPARDTAPRIAHALLSIPGKGSSDFAYGLIVPLIAPIIGGVLGALAYKLIPWAPFVAA